MKKMFMSLLVGFGAALGVFVALAMPPGGWGVAVGVGLGLLGCLPLLLIMVMLINRGHTDQRPAPREYEEPQPIIIIQQPAFQPPPSPYEMYGGSSAAYGYMDAPDYYPQTIEPRRQPRVEPRRLEPNRRRPQEPVYYQPGPEYYAEPPQDYYQPSEYADPYEEAEPEYDPYYDPRQAVPQDYGYAYQPEPARLRSRRAARPTSPRRALRSEDAIEADYRMIGDND